ncbi:hypothetical protein B484DRAFT_438601 [Ochromonadaceae sp. CCMP2298]|nr:hypothetical protein B484DRAFT_438601 [Ochromonadaceae sp. CCMP2298]
MPRARLLFQCVANHLGTAATPAKPALGAVGCVTGVAGKPGMGMELKLVEIVCCPAPSFPSPLTYPQERPTAVDQCFWERLDFEERALGGLNDYLLRHGLGPVPQAQIADAVGELRAMKGE